MKIKDESTNINYFPGHMAKALKVIKETVKQCDAAILVLDARLPISSFPSGLEKIMENKPVFVLLTKPDLADSNMTSYFLDYYEKKGYSSTSFNLKQKQGYKELKKTLESLKTKRDDKFLKMGFKLPPIKCMVLGIPNVGKSTLINILSNNHKAQVENTPGKTKKTTLFKVSDRLWLYDTPGILEPKVHDKKAMINLALAGSIKDTLLPYRTLTFEALNLLRKNYSSNFYDRYKVELNDDNNLAIIDVAKSRNFLLKDNVYDEDKAETTILMELRDGTLGRITFDERQD